MDRLRALEVFKTVVEKGSFVKAATALGLSTTAASRTVSELEALLGVRLLQRTTRRIGLTTEGSEVLEHASRLLETYEELSSVNRMSQSEPSGESASMRPCPMACGAWGPCSRASWSSTRVS